MKRSLLTPRRLLTVLVVLLLISSQLPTSAAKSLSDGPRMLVATAVAPFTTWLHVLSSELRGDDPAELPWEGPRMTREELDQEYGRALRLIDTLSSENRDLREQILRLSEMRRRFGLRGVSLVSARVAAPGRSATNPTLTINRGQEQGLEEGMAVAVSFNLVGRIERASPFTADVRLITAAGTRLQVRIAPPIPDAGPRELVTWIEVRDDGRTFIARQVALRQPVAVGDLVHLGDARWPDEAQGFVVGKVVDVSEDPDDPYSFKNVIIQPIPPLRSLTRVTALVPTE